MIAEHAGACIFLLYPTGILHYLLYALPMQCLQIKHIGRFLFTRSHYCYFGFYCADDSSVKGQFWLHDNTCKIYEVSMELGNTGALRFYITIPILSIFPPIIVQQCDFQHSYSIGGVLLFN